MASQRKTPAEKLAELETRKRQLDARIKLESAKVKSGERKRDTRRKVIAGAVALEHALHDPEFRATLYKKIGENVTREDDRALFALPVLEKP